MTNKYGFIAIGQAGGNIGRLFEEKGYPVLYINTSKEDLNTLEREKYKYHIPGGEGCNKDRKKAKQLIIDDFDNIITEIELKVSAKMLFIIFASGGGTGSGAAPMLAELLIDEEKTIGAITILPSENESIKTKINTYECFSELVEIDGLSSCFILDNNKGEKLQLNKTFVNAFWSFLNIPSKHKSEKGNIDEAEIEETLKTPGTALILNQKVSESSQIIEMIKENIYAPIEQDRAIKYITASISGNISIGEIQKEVGIPMDTFQTYNETETILCMSGLSYPKTRLAELFNYIEDNKETIIKNISTVKDIKLKNGVNFLLETEKKPTQEELHKPPKSKRDIMSKYLS